MSASVHLGWSRGTTPLWGLVTLRYTHTDTCTQTHTEVQIHTDIDMQLHTHIHTHTRIHTPIWSPPVTLPPRAGSAWGYPPEGRLGAHGPGAGWLEWIPGASPPQMGVFSYAQAVAESQPHPATSIPSHVATPLPAGQQVAVQSQ